MVFILFLLIRCSTELRIHNFEQFNDEDYIFLKSTLYLNLLENVNVKIDKADIFKIFDFK